MEEAIQFVMQFYSVSREECMNYFLDEVKSYATLMQMDKVK